jgi:hypothetical protein
MATDQETMDRAFAKTFDEIVRDYGEGEKLARLVGLEAPDLMKGIKAAIEERGAVPGCSHEWEDASNEAVKGGLICSKCWELKPGNIDEV